MEKSGIIQRSLSRWASAVIVVPKKSAPDEPLRRRLCVDYWKVNALQQEVKQIPRRFYAFAEEPHKSTITTTEPCSPVFKEAQPRPSKPFIQFNLKFPHSSLVIIVNYCNKTSSRIVFNQKGISVFFRIILSPEVSRQFPHLHTCTTTYANFKNLLHIRYTLADITPSLVENLMSLGR